MGADLGLNLCSLPHVSPARLSQPGERLNWGWHGEPRVRSSPRRVVPRERGNWRCPPGSTTRAVLLRAVGFVLGCSRCLLFPG